METLDPDTILDIIEQRRFNQGITIHQMDHRMGLPSGSSWAVTHASTMAKPSKDRRIRLNTVRAALHAVGLELYIGRKREES